MHVVFITNCAGYVMYYTSTATAFVPHSHLVVERVVAWNILTSEGTVSVVRITDPPPSGFYREIAAYIQAGTENIHNHMQGFVWVGPRDFFGTTKLLVLVILRTRVKYWPVLIQS